jgi:hypothetical protein
LERNTHEAECLLASWTNSSFHFSDEVVSLG